jgi:uncharacterized membrane protein
LEQIMRIFPVALIVIGSLGVARHFGLIPIEMLHLAGPLLLIALGVALLLRRPRHCRSDWRDRKDGGSHSAPQAPSAGPA